MGAYIEMLPPDRPIFMLGQPIIKLVASGGPGGDLGDLDDMGRRGRGRRGRGWGRGPLMAPVPYPYPALPVPYPGYVQPIMAVTPMAVDDGSFDSSGSMPTAADVASLGQYNTALQKELTTVTAGDAPDVSAEYFRPKNIPGLPSGYEGPHTGRSGVYPTKLRDQVVYDMSGNSAFVSISDIDSALGCCGADGMGEPWNGKPERGAWNSGGMGNFGMPLNGLGNFGMPLADDAAPEAKYLKGRCTGIEAKAKEIVAAVAKAAGDSSLTIDQRKLVARAAKKSLKALRGEWRLCRSRLKAIIKHFKKQGTLETLGLAGLANDVAAEEKVARCKAKLRAIREIACKKKQ